MILTRGGGSFDDLLPFSDESVVRAVAACPVPVVSAVGHEQDTPLCDLAADVRASTPTAAGKLVVPDLEALRVELTRAGSSLERCVRRMIEREQEGLTRTRSALERGARRTLDRDTQRLSLLRDRLRRGPALLVERRRSTLERAAGQLAALSPRATLSRGYAIVRAGDTVLRSAAEVWRRATASTSSWRKARFGARVEDVRPVSELTFETAQQELEQIVERLERGNAGLDEAIKLWERGEELLRFCLARLETAEGKIEELAQRAADAAPLSPGGDGG